MNIETVIALLSLTVAACDLAIALLDRAAAKRKTRRKKR